MNTKPMVTLSESVPEEIKEKAKLKGIMDKLLDNFAAGEEKNKELFDEFINNLFFRGGESFINKCAEIDPNINFDYIKDEVINLSLLLDSNRLRSLQSCINYIKVDNIEKAIKQEIFDKIKSKIGGDAPYADFDTECAILAPTEGEGGNQYESLTSYFKKITSYLRRKESDANSKKLGEILGGLRISNEDLNKRLPTDEQIPTGVPLKDPAVPNLTVQAFDKLLSFEIGEIADLAINMVNDAHDKLEKLFGNSLPAINTIVGEDNELKYDESKLAVEYPDYAQKLENFESQIDNYQGKIEEIKHSESITEEDKKRQINELEGKINEIEKQINSLRWEYYLQYLKKKNDSIGNILQQLYDKDFDFSGIEPDALKEYISKVTDRNLRMLGESGTNEIIKSQFFGDEKAFNDFINFYKSLIDTSQDKIDLLSGGEIPVKKEIVNGKHPWLKDITKFGNKSKFYDALPIRYTIKKSDIDSLPLDEDDKENLHKFLTRVKSDGKEGSITVKGEDGTEHEEPSGTTEGGENYVIEGGDIGTLINLFFFANAREFKTEASDENQENVENSLGRNEETEDENIENGEGEGLTPEQFKEKIEQYGSAKFENGSEIWLPMGMSEIPGGGYQWMKIKLSNVNMETGTFTGTIFGGELEFTKLEGKSKEFKMNQQFFDDLKNIVSEASADEEQICLLPDPDGLSFDSFREKLNGKLGKSKFTFPPDGTTWDGDKFMHKIIENGKEIDAKVNHFGVSGDNKTTYEIQYHPAKRSFTVSSTFNGEEPGKDGKSEKKRFAYKREMDWNNFLIFYNQKGLTPQTEDEYQRALQRQNEEFKLLNGGKWKLYWFSINNIKNGFKDIIGSLKKGIEDYDKRKTEDFKDIVTGPILETLSKLPLPPSLKYAVGQSQEELYNKQFNGARPEIETYLKELQSDEQFADTFDQVPPHVQSIYGKSYKKFLTDLFDRKGEPDITERRKAAALLLANIQKGDSPYRGLSDYENKGIWVKAVLGEWHYNQFMDDRKKCLEVIANAGDDKEQYQAAFARCEMDYIINNVCGSDGKIPFFGSHEERGIPGKPGTNYVPNPSKRILSEKFANELRGSCEWFNKSTIETAYGKASSRNFVQARADFDRFLKSSRNQKGIGNFMRMIDTAKTESQLYELRKCFLIYVLSGLLDVYGDKDMREQVYIWGRTMTFLPGMLAYNTGHAEQSVELIDDFCEEYGYPKFSSGVKSYFQKRNLKNGGLNVEGLIKEVNKRRTPEIDKNFDDYSKHKFKYKHFPEGSTLYNLQKELKNPKTKEVYRPMLKNSLIANSGGLSSNNDIVEDRYQFRDGVFAGEEVKQQEERAKFWKGISKELDLSQKGPNRLNPSNPNDLDLVLTQFLDRFNLDSESDKHEIFTRIKTADLRKDRKGQHSYVPREGGIDMGVIGDKEINSIIWYAFKGNALFNCFSCRKLPKELDDALNNFYLFFKKAFEENTFRKSKIIHESFGIVDENDFAELKVGSWDVYASAIDSNNNLRRDNDQTKNDQGKELLSSRFINSKIAQMEKNFRDRGLGNQYKPIRTPEKEEPEHLMEQL